MDLQQQVDHLADDLLARGVRPTVQLLAIQLDTSPRLLLPALENWAQRLCAPESGSHEQAVTQNAAQLVDVFPYGNRREAMTSAAVAAGLEAASRKEEVKLLERQLELRAEIERARIALAKMEERRPEGDSPTHLAKAIEKARARLLRMQAALDELPPSSDEHGG